MAGLPPYPGGKVPPVGDPRLLDDTELLRRLVPVAVWVWGRRPGGVPLDDEALFNRILFAMYQKARAFDPARGVSLAGALKMASQWLWQQEAADARLIGQWGVGVNYRKCELNRLPSVTRVGDLECDTVDLLPSNVPDPAAYDGPSRAYEDADLDEQELEELLGAITCTARTQTVRVRDAVRLRLVNGMSAKEAAEVLRCNRNSIGRWVAIGVKQLTHHPDARELAGLPPAHATTAA